MIKNYLIALASLLLLLPLSVSAAGYGSAGCGLGSMVMGPGDGIGQVFAATTNGTSGSQTFGITSGTSNCDEGGLIKSSKEREVFAAENYTSLIKEMAQGRGENLHTLASLYQCQAEAYQEFGSMVQEKFDQLIANEQTTPIELLNHLEAQLTRHPNLSKSCSYS